MNLFMLLHIERGIKSTTFRKLFLFARFNVSAAGLYQENKTQTCFTLLSQSVHNPQMFSMFLISFYDVHTVQLWRVSVASPCTLVDGSGVDGSDVCCCDVMARTSCATLRPTMKSGQRIP